MSDKYVLVLGAGFMQRPSIEAVKELGYKALVVDANPNAVCVDFADRFEPIDLKDLKKLEELALSLGDNLAGVFTAGTDFSRSVSYVAEKCHLVSHSYEAACNASDKARMRACFKKAKVSSPDYVEIPRRDIYKYLEDGTLDSLTFPKVIKPVDNMGGRGCRLIRKREEFLYSVEDAVRNSRTSVAIMEDYMEGPEFSIDALVYNDTLTITGFADRHIFYQPYFIEMGHTMPTLIDVRKKNELITAFAKGIKALGLTCGAAKADIKYTKNGPMIGEIAARLSGGYMSGWTFPYASNLELTKQALLMAVGKTPERLIQRRKPLPINDAPFAVYEIPCDNVSAERAWVSIPGKVEKISGIDKAEGCPFVKDVFLRVGVGSPVDFPRNNVEKCGNCISSSQNYEFAVSSAEKAVSKLVVRLEPFNSATDSFLARNYNAKEDFFPPDAYEFTEEQKNLFAEFTRTVPKIPENEKLCALLTEKVRELADTIKDYNHRTIKDTLQQFDELCSVHPEFDGISFWDALVRGGLQGILYLNDCAVKDLNASNFKRGGA